MKLVIKNHTAWNTPDLRKLLALAAEKAGVKRGAIVRIQVKTARRAWASGTAYYGTHGRPGSIQITIPKEPVLARVARVAHHLFLRAVGARARDMTKEQLSCTQDVPWIQWLEIRPSNHDHEEDDEQEVLGAKYKLDAKKAARAAKLAHAEAMLKSANTRLKRATTLQKKWHRKVGALRRAKEKA